MLVLTRRKKQEILIGENGEVLIKIMDIRGQEVHIGIEAPKEVPVHRKEVYERIKDEEKS